MKAPRERDRGFHFFWTTTPDGLVSGHSFTLRILLSSERLYVPPPFRGLNDVSGCDSTPLTNSYYIVRIDT